MKKRSRAGSGKRTKSSRQAVNPNPHTAPREAIRPTSSVSEQGDVARLTRELHQALEQQAATSEVLGLISSSPGELELVFQSILEKATRICEATFGNIYRWQDGALHLVAAHNTPPAFEEARRRLLLTRISTRLSTTWWRPKPPSTSSTQHQHQSTLNAPIQMLLMLLNWEVCGRLWPSRC